MNHAWGATVEAGSYAGTITLTASPTTIPAGTVVTIEAGSSVEGSGMLVVQGSLVVHGTLDAPVLVTGAGFEVRSGGSLDATDVDLSPSGAALVVTQGAGTVSWTRVHVNPGHGGVSISGGTVLIDQSRIEGGSGMNISGAGVRPEIRNSRLSTTGPGGPDFVVLNDHASVWLHHSIITNTHCALHINSADAPLFDFNIIQGNSYAMMYAQTNATVSNSNIGAAGSTDAFSLIGANGLVTSSGNHFARGCAAGMGDGITVTDCQATEVEGAGPMP